ncbi:MAG: hypothetical protein HY556_11575 [Euryarchaeota archaeon]|nr:hypothetical protein [Euryarchaeota archaeon]
MDRVRDVLRKDALPKSNASRKDDWERGWGENLQAYSGGDEIESALRPRYFHPTNVIRWRGDYAGVPDPDFEIRLVAAFRRWIYHAYLRDASRVFEFGCGTGRNLVDLAKVFPEKELVGLDWAQSAVNLVNAVGKAQGLHLRGRLFDFFDPDDTIVMGKGTAIFTLAALEQVGAQHRKFIDFLIGHEPDICVHLEPLVELYEPDHSFDQMAIKYHHMRGYLEGFLPAIRRLESQGQAEILEVRRFQFGSLFHEAYSLLVWRPR